MRFYFSECAVMLYYVDQSPDNAAEIIACVTDVYSEIAILLVNDRQGLNTHWDLPLSSFQSGP